MITIAELVAGILDQKPKGGKVIGTKQAGYIESPIPRQCNKCIHSSNGHCNQEIVMKDPGIKLDPKTNTKIINPVKGCCDYWDPGTGKYINGNA